MADGVVDAIFRPVVRAAVPSDVSVIFQLIRALAEYEELSHEVYGSEAALAEHLFGDGPCIEAFLAEYDDQAAGFALFFNNYSTISTKSGIYLEDLFVLPDYRGRGIGKALLSRLAQLAIERDCGQLEWSVLDWNQPAIAFYHGINAKIHDDERICRLTGDALSSMAKLNSTSLRFAEADDLSVLTDLIQATTKVSLQNDGYLYNALRKHLFGPQPCAEVILMEQAGQSIGFALLFTNYSTFLTKPGIYIESWHILPKFQQQDTFQSLLAYLAQVVLERNYGRLEWTVVTQHNREIELYQRFGAVIMGDWRRCWLTKAAIAQLAS